MLTSAAKNEVFILEFTLTFFVVFDISIKYIIFGKVPVIHAGNPQEFLVSNGYSHSWAAHIAQFLDGREVRCDNHRHITAANEQIEFFMLFIRCLLQLTRIMLYLLKYRPVDQVVRKPEDAGQH